MKNLINNYNSNPYIDVINNDFNKWNNIKSSEQFNDWVNNIPMLGTHGTISINEFISNNKDSLEIISQFALISYLGEINYRKID